MGQACNDVRGPLYTSIVGLTIVVAFGMGAVLALMLAAGTVHGPGRALILWVVATVLVTGSLLWRTEVTVTAHGFRLDTFGRTVWIPWSNVRQIDSGFFGARFIFEQPQLIGRTQKGKFTFALWDPRWRTRPTVQAILAGLTISQSGSEPPGE